MCTWIGSPLVIFDVSLSCRILESFSNCIFELNISVFIIDADYTHSITKCNHGSHYKGISLVEKIAMSVSISLVITIVSAIVLLLVCGFIYWRRISGRWYIHV